MNKLKMESQNILKEHLRIIEEHFPEVITESMDEKNTLCKGVNFEMLKQLLSDDVVEGEECFDFRWVGKKKAIVEATTPIRKTLRPCIEASKNWDNTKNLYIEGDNLEVLKLLQESYLNKVNMIYIDPPYNTGNDSFVYSDKFIMDDDSYEEGIGYRDEDENIYFRQNNDTNPRFHSDWCSMMYSRLKVAQKLLTENGLLFVSIDDNEMVHLTNICNEVFGESNFVGNFAWRRKVGAGADSKLFFRQHEYILLYAKNKNSIDKLTQPLTEIQKKEYSNPDNDPRGDWAPTDLSAPAHDNDPKRIYDVKTPTGKVYKKCWAYTYENMQKLLEDNLVWFGHDNNAMPKRKRFLKDKAGLTTRSWIDNILTSDGKKDLDLLEIKQLFDYPKPTKLIKHFLTIGSNKDSVVLDFFSGSATTAHAVMQLNAEDGGNRKFIMVQLPELVDEKSEAFKAGYKNISEIGKERIRRAGEKIKQDNQDKESIENLDIGFRVFKVDNTNMKDVYYSANEYDQGMLDNLIYNIKEDRNDLDLLYGVLIDWGLPLSLKHEMEEIDGVTVHTVDQGSLVACFADQVPEKVIREIAKRQPSRVVFRDSSFASSPEKINVEEIFKLHAPKTSVRVI